MEPITPKTEIVIYLQYCYLKPVYNSTFEYNICTVTQQTFHGQKLEPLELKIVKNSP
jgi:hypothetical protein